MFDRSKYKRFARMQLKSRWTTPVLMTLISAMAMTIMNLPELKSAFQDFSDAQIVAENTKNSLWNFRMLWNGTGSTATSILDNIVQWLAVFVNFVLTFSMASVFIKMSHGPEERTLGDFVEGFSLWAKAILAGLWKSIWISLWTLLLFIPGIVKMYAYSQMEYLLLEYPELSVTKAMNISKIITRGYKTELFILDLSFLPWVILCTMTAGIGFLWLSPYINMTKVNAYHAILKEAVEKGVIKPEDLRQ